MKEKVQTNSKDKNERLNKQKSSKATDESKVMNENCEKNLGFIKKIGFVSLGCDKNRVDTERIITTLSCYPNFEFVASKEEAQVIIVNTCAFLKSARDEANGVINEMLQLKSCGKLEKLVVAGCLPLMDKKLVKRKFPQVDLVVVPEEYEKIDELIFNLYKDEIKSISHKVSDYKKLKTKIDFGRMLTTPTHYAYLKIADGCNMGCAFCKIPSIRGSYKSVDMEVLLKEVDDLTKNKVKELILVAQDTTRYGLDLYKGPKLTELLNKLLKIKNLSWIRLLYCYPDMITDEVIATIKDNPKVLKYIDIPLQHVADNVLKNMRRSSTRAKIEELILKLRREIPEIKIRTTFMVGFPGETEEDFESLIQFLRTYKLDNVGFFKYSREEGTASYSMPQIDEETKDRRLKIAQKTQEKIAEENNKSMVGSIFKIIVDGYDQKHKFFVGRPYFSAPDIDFEVLFTSYSKLTKVGGFAEVKITDFAEGYFIGELV